MYTQKTHTHTHTQALTATESTKTGEAIVLATLNVQLAGSHRLASRIAGRTDVRAGMLGLQVVNTEDARSRTRLENEQAAGRIDGPVVVTPFEMDGQIALGCVAHRLRRSFR